MKEQSQALLTKASDNLAASKNLIRGSHYEIAASRAYYTMFYAAEALLLDEGSLRRRVHRLACPF